MNVTLIDYTGNGFPDPANYAAAILIFTKNTRLQMAPGLLQEILAWPLEKKEKELKAMARTIPSSWEFIDYTFLLEDVSRAYTHQAVRSRHMSFAQQTMRVLNVSEGEGRGWNYHTGPSVEQDYHTRAIYNKAMDEIDQAYKDLIASGAKVEDARGVLPTNIHTNIVIKMNLRTFVETVRKRSSVRVQGEYRDALDGIHAAVVEAHPWVEMFIETDSFSASKELERAVLGLPIPREQQINMIKLIDIMRQG